MNNKIAIYPPPFKKLKSYKDIIDLACQFGVKCVEPFCVLEFEKPDKEKALEIKKYADERGIIIPCFSVYADISENGYEFELERLKGFAEVAAIMGSPFLHHTIVGEFENPEKVTCKREGLMEAGIKLVREVYDYAEKLGVRAIYEEQGFIFNGVKGFGEFLDKVERDVGVVADFGNIHQSGDGFEEFIHAFHDRFVHAHIKDIRFTNAPSDTAFPALDGRFVDYVEIGTGELDIKGFIDLLRFYGYDGYYGIEYSVQEEYSPRIEEMFKRIDKDMNA